MTQQTFNRLAEEARERHKHDLPPDATEEERFWHEWSGWMKKKATMGVPQSLSYMGKNDPTASAAIGNVMHEEHVMKRKRTAYRRHKHDAYFGDGHCSYEDGSNESGDNSGSGGGE